MGGNLKPCLHVRTWPPFPFPLLVTKIQYLEQSGLDFGCSVSISINNTWFSGVCNKAVTSPLHSFGLPGLLWGDYFAKPETVPF